MCIRYGFKIDLSSPRISNRVLDSHKTLLFNISQLLLRMSFCCDLVTCGVMQGATGLSGVGAMAAGGIGAFSGNMQFGNMANMFAGGCQKVQAIRIPDAEPKWSCGLEMSGRFTCAGE